MREGDIVKVAKGIRRGEVGKLKSKEFVAVFGHWMWKVEFEGGQAGLFDSGELRKV